MSKTTTVGNWTFTENAGKVDIAFKGTVVDTVDAEGALALGTAAFNHVLSPSLLPLATVLEGVAAQALKALE